MVIYLDVLLLSNLWINWLLLWATAKWTHRRLPSRRGCFAAMLGAAFSLVIFLPPMPTAIWLLLRVLSALGIVRIAFGKLSPTDWLRQTFWFGILSLLFCGTVYAFGTQLLPFGFTIANSAVYMDCSLLALLFATTAAAAIASFSARKRDLPSVGDWQLHLRIDGKDFCLDALADTGNSLRDVFSGRPVIICSAAQLTPWLQQFPDAETAAMHCKGFRMLPTTTVTGTQLLPAFTPERIALCHPRKHSAQDIEHPMDAMLAITSEQTPAIVPACCLQELKGGNTPCNCSKHA